MGLISWAWTNLAPPGTELDRTCGHPQCRSFLRKFAMVEVRLLVRMQSNHPVRLERLGGADRSQRARRCRRQRQLGV